MLGYCAGGKFDPAEEIAKFAQLCFVPLEDWINTILRVSITDEILEKNILHHLTVPSHPLGQTSQSQPMMMGQTYWWYALVVHLHAIRHRDRKGP